MMRLVAMITDSHDYDRMSPDRQWCLKMSTPLWDWFSVVAVLWVCSFSASFCSSASFSSSLNRLRLFEFQEMAVETLNLEMKFRK